MGQPAAKKGDQIKATDSHFVVVPPAPPVLTPGLPFLGLISGSVSADVRIMGQPAATVGSQADNVPPHIVPPPAFFSNPPTNKGTIQKGSGTVRINGKAAARNGDTAITCNDPADAPVGAVVAVGTVSFGD